MIDIDLYRNRIGTFTHRCRTMKFLRKYEPTNDSANKAGRNTLTATKAVLKLLLILFLVSSPCSSNSEKPKLIQNQILSKKSQFLATVGDISENIVIYNISKKETANFKARYLYGNKQAIKRGIINMHLNIRSLRNKIFEVKNIVKQHNPHILGLSECELRKVGGHFDEDNLKVPGYNLLFPKSWTAHGFARTVVYVKKSLEVEQISDLEDDGAICLAERGI